MKEEKKERSRKLGSKIKPPKNLISAHAEGLNVEVFSMSRRCSGCGGASEQLISCWGDCVHLARANKYKWQGKGCCSLTQLFS